MNKLESYVVPIKYCFYRMIAAIRESQMVSQKSLKSLMLLEEPSLRESISTLTFTPEESYPKIKVLAEHVVVDIKTRGKQMVTFVNSLAHERVQLVTLLVNSFNITVWGV